MAVRLERKLFTCFKWLCILFPLFLALGNYVNKLFIQNSFNNIVKSENSTELIQKWEDYQGEDLYDEYMIIGFETELKTSMNVLKNVFPLNILVNNIPTDIVSGITYKIANSLGNVPYSTFMNSVLRVFTFYLSWVLFVELLFMCLYFYRYFIHFFINLFERKQDI